MIDKIHVGEHLLGRHLQQTEVVNLLKIISNYYNYQCFEKMDHGILKKLRNRDSYHQSFSKSGFLSKYIPNDPRRFVFCLRANLMMTPAAENAGDCTTVVLIGYISRYSGESYPRDKGPFNRLESIPIAGWTYLRAWCSFTVELISLFPIIFVFKILKKKHGVNQYVCLARLFGWSS